MTAAARSAIPLPPLCLVAAGGAVGAGVRWAVVELSGTTGTFPWWTLAVNVAGCLVLGLLLGGREGPRLGLGTGFCGGLTTFSTFAVEIAVMLDDGAVARAAVYLAVSLATGVAAVVTGRRLAPAA